MEEKKYSQEEYSDKAGEGIRTRVMAYRNWLGKAKEYVVFFVCIASLYQLYKLYRVDALSFFSRGQVLSDSLLFGSYFFLYYIVTRLIIALAVRFLKGWRKSSNKIDILIIILTLIVAVGLACLVGFFLPDYFSSATIDIFFVCTMGIMGGMLTYSQVLQGKDAHQIGEDFMDRSGYFVFIVLFGVVSGWSSNHVITIDSHVYNISYQNDQYLFTTGFIYGKSGNIFYFKKPKKVTASSSGVQDEAVIKPPQSGAVMNVVDSKLNTIMYINTFPLYLFKADSFARK